LEVPVDDSVYYGLRVCVMAIIRSSQFTFRKYCAILLSRLVLELCFLLHAWPRPASGTVRQCQILSFPHLL